MDFMEAARLRDEMFGMQKKLESMKVEKFRSSTK
jgi:hypothetical protein